MMREIIFQQGLEDYPCPFLKWAGKQQHSAAGLTIKPCPGTGYE